MLYTVYCPSGPSWACFMAFLIFWTTHVKVGCVTCQVSHRTFQIGINVHIYGVLVFLRVDLMEARGVPTVVFIKPTPTLSPLEVQ